MLATLFIGVGVWELQTLCSQLQPPQNPAALPEGRSQAASAPQRQRDPAAATPAVPGPTRGTGTRSGELGEGKSWQRS